MTWILDAAVILLLAFCAYMGIRKGLLWQVAVLGFVLVSFLLVVHGHPPVKSLLMRWVENPGTAGVLSYVALLVIALIGVVMALTILKGAVEVTKLKIVDHVLGGIIGLLAGWIFSAVVLTGVVHSHEPAVEELLHGSRTAPTILRTASWGDRGFSKECRDVLHRFFHPPSPVAGPDPKPDPAEESESEPSPAQPD